GPRHHPTHATQARTNPEAETGTLGQSRGLAIGAYGGKGETLWENGGLSVHRPARREAFPLAEADKKPAAAAHHFRRGAGTGGFVWSCRVVVFPAQIQSQDSQRLETGASAHPALGAPPAP